MKVKTTSIDSNTGEVSTEEWDLPLFGPERLAHAWHQKAVTQNFRHDPLYRVHCAHWDWLLVGMNVASFVIKEYANGRLECTSVGFAEVMQ